MSLSLVIYELLYAYLLIDAWLFIPHSIMHGPLWVDLWLFLVLVGGSMTFDKMDQIREQQEQLARLHFEMDIQQDMQRSGIFEV